MLVWSSYPRKRAGAQASGLGGRSKSSSELAKQRSQTTQRGVQVGCQPFAGKKRSPS